MSKGDTKKKNQNAKSKYKTIKKAERYQAKNYTKVVTPSFQIKKLSVSDAKKKKPKKR